MEATDGDDSIFPLSEEEGGQGEARFPPLDPEAGGDFDDPATDVQFPRRSGIADIEPPPVIHTKGFRRWFGDWKDPEADHSVIVDERGRPDVLFHGTILQPDEQIGGFESGSFGLSRSLGVHLAFDNRITDAFTVGREARKTPDYIRRSDPPGERAMARIKPGGRVLPVFANVRSPLDLASGFEPLSISGEEVWKGKIHDDHLIQHAVVYLALKADPSLLGEMEPNLSEADLMEEVERQKRRIRAGDVPRDEIPPGGDLALAAENRSASVSVRDDVREKFLSVFFENYDYDGLIYVNTSGQEVMREEIDPLSLVVFDPTDVFSIYASEFNPGDSSLGVRGNPPVIEARPSADEFQRATGLLAPKRANVNDGFSSHPRPSTMPTPTDTGSTGNRTERLEDRLRRQSPTTRGDGAPSKATPRPNAASGESGDQASESADEDVRQNDREEFVRLMQTAAKVRELFLEKREKIIEKGGEEAARKFAEGFGPLFELLREAADENDADFEEVREEVGLVEQVPDAVPERGAFGFPKGSFDDAFYLAAQDEPAGRIAVRPSESARELAEYDIESDGISATLDKGAIDRLREGQTPIEVESWERSGGRWEVALGDPYSLDLHIEFGDDFDGAAQVDKAYRVKQMGGGTARSFALFIYDLAKSLAPDIEEVRVQDVQWRVADFAHRFTEVDQREGEPADGYVMPNPGQAYRLGRPTEPEADPTIVMRSEGLFSIAEEGVFPDAELDRAEERARQTGIKTALFLGHGISAVGQPEEVTRVVVGEKDLKTKPAYRHEPSTYSWVHSRSPQTISQVDDENRGEPMGRGSRSTVTADVIDLSDMENRRVFPVQVQKENFIDTFYRWHQTTKPEAAVDAESAEDLGFPEAGTTEESVAEITRDFRPEDIGGQAYQQVGSDVDLTGRGPVEMTPEERREANRRAVEIITNNEPSQITDEDREVMLEYSGAGGLGTDTGTGSVRGERTEHYTDYRLIRAMWSAMDNMGQEGNILEPGAGIGNFAGLRPNDHVGNMVMVEESTTTADILEVLYPEQQTLHRNLASVDLRPYQIQAAIGNVPFSASKIHTKSDPVVQGLADQPSIHDYFILRSLHEVEEGGVVMLITSTTTADRQDATLRRAMVRGVSDPGAPMSDHRAAFLGGFRLPSETFEKSASTSITTDLLIFQKLPAGFDMSNLPAEVFERTNDFASQPAQRSAVLRPDRSEASEEEKEIARRLERERERLMEKKNRLQAIESELEDLNDRQREFSWNDPEYDEIRTQIREKSSERRDVKSDKRDVKRQVERLEEELEASDAQRVTAHLNKFFDNREEFVVGDLKFGFKRQALDQFGVDGDLEDATEAVADFDPDLPVEPTRAKDLFREGTGQALGIDRQHPDGAVVFRDEKFYEAQPVGYSRMDVEEDVRDKARSAVDILETYKAFTLALARETEDIEAVRRSLKAKLKNHVRRFGLPGDDPELMDDVFRFDPRRPTLSALVERNEVGKIEFADVIGFDQWYRNDKKSSIEDDENLEAISQFLRAQGERMTAESYARFYKGGELDVSEMEEVLEEAGSFYFIPNVGPIEVKNLDEETVDRVLDEIDFDAESAEIQTRTAVVEAATEAYVNREGSYLAEVFFTSGEIWTRLDLYEAIREHVNDADIEERLSKVLEELRGALPRQKEYWDIDIDPRHYRSWLPVPVIQEWIKDTLGYETEMEWIDAPENPDDRKLILRYRNNGVYAEGFDDDNKTDEDRSMGWHGITYSNIVKRYLKGQHFPIKFGGSGAYVDPETQEPIGGVTTKEEAKARGILTDNRAIQAQNETKMREEIPSDFQTWADDAGNEIQERIAEAYNRTYRSRAFPNFDGSTLNLPGFNFPKPIFEHNLASAEKMVFNRGGGNNHAVGAGKTFSSIIATETLRQRGLVNKPLFVVPSQVIEKWMREYQELFPDARLLVLRGKSEGLEEELFRAQVYDYDAIFITISGFKALELSPDAKQDRINDRIDRNAEIAEEITEELESDFPKTQFRNVPENIEGAIEDWREELQKLSAEAEEGSVDKIYLDELGVDAFIFDEAHAYKNALSPSSLAQDIGIAQDTPSQRAEDAKTKVDWLFWKMEEDVNSFILTATPLENNPLEVWHMLQLCGPSVLERYGIESLDAFIDLYVKVENRMERSVDGEFSAENVVTGFTNVSELQRVLSERLDIKSYEELINFYLDPPEEGGLGMDPEVIPFGRPDARIHKEVLEPSEIHEVLLEDIRARANIIRKALSKGQKITDNFLSLTTDGGLMAEDLRLYQPAFWGYDGTGLKIDSIAEEVEEEYSRRGLPLDENGDPIYPPEENGVRENPAVPVRANPRVVTDRFGAPVGRVADPEEQENPDSLGKTFSRAARANPTETEEDFIERIEVGEAVEAEDGSEVEVEEFAPRNQIIFTSNASFKDGPHNADNPAEDLPYVQDVKRYRDNNMEPPNYVVFETASWLREIKQRLIDQGVPAEDIAIVSGTIIGLEEGPDGEMQDRFVESDDDKNALKAEVQDQFQRGEINVLIGTNAISEGMNLDKYTTKMYHLDVPWKPSNVEQRNGRGLRQGNIYGEIDIKFFLLDKSFDNYRLKLVEQKQSWIDDVLYGEFELGEGEGDTVRTEESSGGSGQSIDYQEMMVATSESDVVRRFFEAVHKQDQMKPRLDRLRGERSTRKRKRKAAEQSIEDYERQLDAQRSEFSDVLGVEIPAEEDLEEGVHYEVDFRYNRGKEWRGELLMKITGEKSFEFTGGVGVRSEIVGGGTGNAGQKLITARITDGSPKVKIFYGWSARSRSAKGSDYRRDSSTYLQEQLNGEVADQDDWIGFWEEDVREVVEQEIRSQVKDNLGEGESLDEENLPAVPEPLNVEALYSLFSDSADNRLDDMIYSEVKKMLGLEPGGRFGTEECWERWTPVIEEQFPREFLGYVRTYQTKAEESISAVESRLEDARNRRDLLADSLEDVATDIEETKEKLEEAEQTIEKLKGRVNDEMQSRFDNRAHLYQYLNRVRGNFGIEERIPKRIVGADTGADTEPDEEESEDEPMTDATIEDVSDDEDKGLVSIDEDEFGEGEASQDESEPIPGSADKPAPINSARLRAEIDRVSGGSHTLVVNDAEDYIAWAESRASGPGVEVDPAVLFDEERDAPGFDSPMLGENIRETIVRSGGGIWSDWTSPLAKRVSSPIPHVIDEDRTLRDTWAFGQQGTYIDRAILVRSPVGEDAFELWLHNYAQRQVQFGDARTEEKVRQRLRSDFGGFEPSQDPEQLFPTSTPIFLDYEGIIVPPSPRLRAPELSDEQASGLGLMDAFVVLSTRGGGGAEEGVFYLYADHWQFVMQALTGGNAPNPVEAEDVKIGMLSEGDWHTSPPAVYFSTPAGVQAFVKVAGAGDPEVDPLDGRASRTRDIGGLDLPGDLRPNPEEASGEPSSGSASKDRRDIFPTAPIGKGRVRSNPGQAPTDVASVDTDHALSYLARTEPGSFKVNTGATQVRANEEEVHHIFTDPDGSLLLIIPDSRVETTRVPEGTAEEAEEMHEEFTHYESDGESMVMDLPDSDPDDAPVVGHAEEIIYESDKVMRPGDEKGEVHTYVHEFDDGERPVIQWDDVAVVDDVAVDGRGILN